MDTKRDMLMPGTATKVAAAWVAVIAILLFSDAFFFNVLLVLAALMWSYFYFVPERTPIEKSETSVIAPVDGTVEAVETSPEGLHLTIRKNIWDTAAVYAPVTGESTQIGVTHGLFLPIEEPLSLRLNEQGIIRYRWMDHELKMSLRCGMFAWELPLYAGGSKVFQGDIQAQLTHGVVSLNLPRNIHSAVAPGDRVLGGVSVLARM
jgi:phosphatidylserine decarboxylase